MADLYPVTSFIEPAQLRTDLEVDERDISLSMMRQSGLFAYYSTLAAQAQRQLDQMEQLEEIIAARLDKKARDNALSSGSKITEAQVKAFVALEPKAIAIRRAVNEARMVASICKSAADSFRHRRDMLIQLSFNGREERKGELRMMEDRQQAGREQRHQRMEAMHRTD